MNAKRIANQYHATFEGVRQVDEDGNEYWFARDLAPLLDYQDWRNFMQVVEKARLACEKSGRAVDDHFGDVTRMVGIGSGAKREIADVRLSEDEKRLAIRNELAEHNKYLAAAAKDAGVDTPLDYAIFQDHGYKGLYGGMGAKDIHARKGLKEEPEDSRPHGQHRAGGQFVPRHAGGREAEAGQDKRQAARQSGALRSGPESAPDHQGAGRYDA